MIRMVKPMLGGAVMGLVMLAMIHVTVSGQSALAGPALAVFAALHVLVPAFIIGAGVMAARVSPRLRLRLQRLHRPGWPVPQAMAVGMVLTAGGLHLFLHGGMV